MPERRTSPEVAPPVSVVVCTYTADRLDLLRGLARSIAAGTSTPAELVVVVDRNPGLLEALEPEIRAGVGAWTLPTRVIASAGRGLSAARNTGWRAATTDWVAFIDDDAVAGDRWLEELMEGASDHDADVVGGRIDPEWPAGTPGWYTDRLGWVVGCSYRGLPIEASRVRNVIGCNMLMRRSLLERLGGFDEDLGRIAGGLAGCEETELCIRANLAGARVLSLPDAAVRQVLPPERSTVRYAVRRSWDEGRSKAAIRRLHRAATNVLDPESTYARGLVLEAAGRLATAVRRRDSRELARGAAQLAVLGTTGVSYVIHAWRPSFSKGAALQQRLKEL